MVSIRNMSVYFILILIKLISCSEVPDDSQSIVLDHDYNSDPDLIKFKTIQDHFFKAISNSSVPKDIRSFQELMQIFDTDAGREIGKLFLQGFFVGINHKDSDKIFGQFWDEFQNKLSPQFARMLSDYKDVFKGIDFYSVLATWNQLFQKDMLGNTLAGLPLGQLIDLVQPTASKYGVDVRSVVNGIIGNNGSNFPQLFMSMIDQFDLTSFLKKMSASLPKDSKSSNAITDSKTPKELSANLSALKLFKPLLANFLRDNHIDLDADAIFDVIAPIINNGQDILKVILPQLSSLLGSGGDTAALLPQLLSMMGNGGDGASLITSLLPLLGQLGSKPLNNNNFEREALLKHADSFDSPSKPPKSIKHKHGTKQKKRQGAELTGIASLISGLANTKGVNMMGLLGLASQFMSSDSETEDGPSFKFHKHPTEEQFTKDTVSLEALAEMAAKLSSDGESTPDVLMKAAALLEHKRIKSTKDNTITDNIQTEKPRSRTDKPKPQTDVPKPKKYLVDILEPVLLSVQKDKTCHSKIRSVLNFGKSILSKKSVGVNDLKQLLLPLISQHVSENTKFAEELLSFSKKEWLNFAHKLKDINYRKKTAKAGVIYFTDLLKLLSKDSVKKNLFLMAMPRIDEVLTSWGMSGLTLENFPSRITPMIGLMSRNWNLPFNPVTLLVPLKNQLISIRDWSTSNLSKIGKMSKSETSEFIEDILEDVGHGLSDFSTGIQHPKYEMSCLPNYLCHAAGDGRSSARLFTTRLAGLLFTLSDALDGADLTLALDIVQSTLISSNCQIRFPKSCNKDILENPSKSHVHTDL